ncbi:hypothetical protein SISNIDRAFT_322227 [Sistotremastrum niveocremeum HHB9708]|uniref:Peptidase S1 domain-containing protein n=2 Tax=Sistotremastraceae TaxID=3402574 RepID=A0A164MX77_9AGAM|nr:hypothetical protein SISNIDRAFT_322227 [Sistotremastrum niveocremeum HHB9708]KZT32204.1 hypothetical protein SISSUDRAFT_569258 [Sistotremastrum suecicum HHB10207 ss-3]
MYIPAELQLSEGFIDACLNAGKHEEGPNTYLSSSSWWSGERPIDKAAETSSANDVPPNTPPLTDKYPFPHSDFFPYRTPCIYKSGSQWPTHGPLGERLIREPRPVYDHPIQSTWISIGTSICDELESHGILWTSVNAFAYANAGDPKSFCPLIICVGVIPSSLSYDAAIDSAALVKKILAESGFPEIEVAFIESLMTRSSSSGSSSGSPPKLLSFHPLINNVPHLRKPFTPTLGLSIASRTNPFCEGTGAFYFRLPGDDDRIALLTCAHVARPPPLYSNASIAGTNCQRREEIVAPGFWGFDNAVSAMLSTVGEHLYNIDAWNDAVVRLGEAKEGEDEEVVDKRKEYLDSIKKAVKEIRRVKALHADITENFTTLDQRVIGFVLRSESIEDSVEPYQFPNDWALIELYKDKIDWKTFTGNKVWIGGNISPTQYANTLFPHPQDRKSYKYPQDGLLQAFNFLRADELNNPHHLDAHGNKCILVVKNGLGTGTTIGALNGLESFTYSRSSAGSTSTSNVAPSRKALEFAVLPHDNTRTFSEAGDSGSIVLDREGRVVGMVTGASGSLEEDEASVSYVTPYWWILEQMEEKFPGIELYEAVN